MVSTVKYTVLLYHSVLILLGKGKNKIKKIASLSLNLKLVTSEFFYCSMIRTIFFTRI